MGNAPRFSLFPIEKFEEFKTSMNSVPKIYKRKILGIFPVVTTKDTLYEFISHQTIDITNELENITYDLEDVTHEFIDVTELGTSACTSIGYFWFNKYLIHKKGIDLFSEPSCEVSHSTDGRGGKTYYAVYSYQLSRDLLSELNQLNITKKNFDKFSEEMAKRTETQQNCINPANIKNYYLSAVMSFIITKAFLVRINESLMGLLILPPEYL